MYLGSIPAIKFLSFRKSSEFSRQFLQLHQNTWANTPSAHSVPFSESIWTFNLKSDSSLRISPRIFAESANIFG